MKNKKYKELYNQLKEYLKSQLDRECTGECDLFSHQNYNYRAITEQMFVLEKQFDFDYKKAWEQLQIDLMKMLNFVLGKTSRVDLIVKHIFEKVLIKIIDLEKKEEEKERKWLKKKKH